MKSSKAKIIWNIFSKILNISFLIFIILDILIIFLIIKQLNFKLNQTLNLIIIFIVMLFLVFAISVLLSFLPGLLQFIYLLYGRKVLFFLLDKVIPKLMPPSYSYYPLDYNFYWSLPDTMNRFVSFNVGGQIIDFLFWSFFVFSVFFTLFAFRKRLFGYLLKKKVTFALEEMSKAQEAEVKYTEKHKPLPKKKFILLNVLAIFLIPLLILGGIFLYQKWENKKYPVLWQNDLPGTAVKYEKQYSDLKVYFNIKEGELLPNNIKPGEPRISDFTIDEDNKRLIMEISLFIQPPFEPIASIEIELINPDGKSVFYLSKDDILKGIPSNSSNKTSSIREKFEFTSDKKGKYTLKITPFDYGISSIVVKIHGIND